jgi:mRNA interferase HigB
MVASCRLIRGITTDKRMLTTRRDPSLDPPVKKEQCCDCATPILGVRSDVHVVKKKTLQDFWRQHRDAEIPLRAWLKDAERASWKTMHDIKAYARTADAVGDNRVVFVFNIGGNKYRLVVLWLLRKGRLYIRFVATHRDHDGIDVTKV